MPLLCRDLQMKLMLCIIGLIIARFLLLRFMDVLRFLHVITTVVVVAETSDIILDSVGGALRSHEERGKNGM